MPNKSVAEESSAVDNSISEIVQFDWAGDTIVGKVRRVNEDCFGCRDGMYVVADGMGGHEAGDVASRIVVDQFVDTIASTPIGFESLEGLILSANAEVREQAAVVGHVGMGATLVALVWVVHNNDPYLAVVNVGDSRCYVSDTDGFRRVTHDHSLVQDLVDSGQISLVEARTHPDRNVVTRAIGVDPDVVADYVLLPAAGQQRLLLCSDGVSAQIDEAEVQRILVNANDPQEAVRELIAAVMEGRAPDNATAVVIDVTWKREAVVSPADEEITSPRGLIATAVLPPPSPLDGVNQELSNGHAAPAKKPMITQVPASVRATTDTVTSGNDARETK